MFDLWERYLLPIQIRQKGMSIKAFLIIGGVILFVGFIVRQYTK